MYRQHILLDLVAATGHVLYSAEEAGGLLGYPSTNAFLEEIRRGKLALPSVKRGHKIMFTATGIASYLNAVDEAYLDQQADHSGQGSLAAVVPVTEQQHHAPDGVMAEGERQWLRSLATRPRVNSAKQGPQSQATEPETPRGQDISA